jgi:Gas vesicle protein G
MGVIAGLLLLPLTAPVQGVTFVLERLRDEAEAVMSDEDRSFAELIDLSMRCNAGQLSEAEFAEREEELLRRLSSIREYKEVMMDSELDADADTRFDFESDTDEFEEFDAEPDVPDYESLDAEPEAAGVQC